MRSPRGWGICVQLEGLYEVVLLLCRAQPTCLAGLPGTWSSFAVGTVRPGCRSPPPFLSRAEPGQGVPGLAGLGEGREGDPAFPLHFLSCHGGLRRELGAVLPAFSL